MMLYLSNAPVRKAQIKTWLHFSASKKAQGQSGIIILTGTSREILNIWSIIIKQECEWKLGWLEGSYRQALDLMTAACF